MIKSGRAVVISEYDGVDATISLKRLDHVDVIETTDKWWYVSIEGRCGYYPAFCLSELGEQRLPEGWVKCVTAEKSKKTFFFQLGRLCILNLFIVFIHHRKLLLQ